MEKTESSNLKIVDDDTYKRKIIVQQNLGKQARYKKSSLKIIFRCLGMSR